MALITKAIKGTQDVLPAESYKYQFVESTLIEKAGLFGFKEIRTPVFEHTELFERGVGDTTDVVQKEMYTFMDKGNRSITLRPEGTAGVIRAYLEHGLFNEPQPQKLCYLTSCYRYEKPQAGRYREFHQFGIECVGTAEPAADAEIIALAQSIFDEFEIDNIHLEINSIGCPECRKNYTEALKKYFSDNSEHLCDTCKQRLERNPMRILDCKNPDCKKISENAPVVIDYLCDDCAEHFDKVKKYLDVMNIEYRVNPKIVRGLDYYTRTVFEFISDNIGAQGTVCGGGRYDGLCNELGGNSIPSLGFGLGIERLMLLLDFDKLNISDENIVALYICSMNESSSFKAAEIAYNLRNDGLNVQFDINNRSLKAQMKYADKIGAVYTVVLGEDELQKGEIRVKNMITKDITSLTINSFDEDFINLYINFKLGQED